MMPGLVTFTFSMFWAAGVGQSVLITQWPSFISSLPSGSAEMHCYQNNTDYYYLYWYRQLKGKGPQLIVTIIAGRESFEAEFESGFKAVRSEKKHWSLSIASVQNKDEAVYLVSNYEPAYFGNGTKLTVLEPNINVTPPTVKILQPSLKDCKDKKDKTGKKNKRTLVCVASGFYPDHVSVLWKIEAENVTDGVATDNAALRDGEKYSITSRLRVPARTWHTPGMKFTCIVSFFDGNDTIDHSDSVYGTELGQGEGMTREKYLKITQTAKLSYGVFIAKSSLYGVFVLVLVWKLQASSGKQSN
ncbi:M1-specific T cell receptor beta chain [Centroberyx affinis]|uniref:M1-specific T cell receptor beta chain n=1 Tax=Centroberyx affinis TaxID=166261 RepID=UPI003A5C2592